jgi:hypothetical protein
MAKAAWPRVHVRAIHVTASQETVKRRLLTRNSARDRVKLDGWDTYWRQFGVLQCNWHGVQSENVANELDNDFSAIERILRSSIPNAS